MKEPMTGTKIRMMPARMPGMLSGSMIRRKTGAPAAPRLRAASISEFVDRLQGDVAGQDHIGQVGVDEADHDSRIGEHESSAAAG